MKKILPILFLTYSFSITTEDIYDNSWALIIGIDEYENVQQLNYAVKDAESIQDMLVSSFNFPEDNIMLLINEEATKDNIIQSFSDIVFKAKENDRVLICFAGHGDTMDLPGGGEAGYLLPVDGNAKNLYVSSIGMDELKKISSMSQAKHVLFLVDACYGGVAAIGSRGLDADTTPNYIEKITNNNARQIISAGGRGEKVIEKAEWGHSAFTLNLSRGLKDKNADLNGDGYITGTELGLFLSEKVTIDSDSQQTPQFGRLDSQEGEFVFIVNYNIEEVKEVQIIEKSSEIDYDLLSSKIAEKLQDGNEDDGQKVKQVKVIDTEESSKKGQMSWGIDISLINSQFAEYIPYRPDQLLASGIKTNGYMLSVIPKMIYEKERIKISIGYALLNKFHYQLSYDAIENYNSGEGAIVPYLVGRSTDFDLDVQEVARVGIQYNIFKIGAFPIILNMDMTSLVISGEMIDQEYLSGDYPVLIYGGRYDIFSFGVGTQLMLLSNRFNIEVGMYDIGRTLVNELGNFHTLNPDIYLKVGYDMLSF